MTRKTFIRFGCVLAWALGTALPAWSVDITGSSVQLSWAPASGPVTGYGVFVSRNGSGPVQEQTVSGTSVSVSAQAGETLTVSVAAHDANWAYGPMSPVSETLNFVASAPAPTPTPTPTPGLSPGDMDGNGVDDLLWHGTGGGNVTAWLLDTGGALIASQVLGREPGPDYEVVAVADFDRDGQRDLFWRDPTTGDNLIWLLTGTGVTALSMPSKGTGWAVGGARDFDGDGFADVFWTHDASDRNRLWIMERGADFIEHVVDNAPTGWELAAVGDWDGDGTGDLLWKSGSGALEGWLMRGGQVAGSTAFPSVNKPDRVEGVADLDGDGRDDLLWHTRTRYKRRQNVVHRLEVWFMRGLSRPAAEAAGRHGRA